MSAYLIMKDGMRAGSRFRLVETEPNLLGRDWDCRVVLNDPQCSRVHASIYFEGALWWIKDHGSSNGTYVNGQRAKSAQLIDGTEVRLGGSTFDFSTQMPAANGSDSGSETEQTLVFDERFNVAETGEYTLDFLRDHQAGEDFFFLFQLAVKLLGVEDPDEVVRLCVRRLHERTDASISGFMWLTDHGQLTPKVVFPNDPSNRLALNEKLTEKVVKKKHAIRIERSQSKKTVKYADLMCIPLIQGGEVFGALHLYRQAEAFRDAHFKLAGSVANIMVRSLARANRHATIAADHQRLVSAAADTDELIGTCEPMQDLKNKIQRIAKATGCVLVRGESGSGKELVARALHKSSPRADRPMLSVNCAAIPRELMESQLFGHKKGAFTSADSDHVGWFQQADRSTLFLDEIGELTLEGQAKLLRILEGHPFLPVGGTEEITVDVRVICATNRNLLDFVAEKKFREDLYYRLSVFELVIPPLRERGEDIRLLVEHFFDHFSQRQGRTDLSISDDAMAKMLSFQWPGNIRQLRNVIDSAVVLADGDQVGVGELGFQASVVGDDVESLKIDFWERKLIKKALDRTRGSVPKAAELLGVSRATLYRKVDEYGIERG